MSATDTAQSAAWLRACRRAVDSVRALLAASPLTEQRAAYTGLRGEGGDRTLQLDFDAEAAILEQLAELHRRGLRFQALSEERGLIDFGGDDLRVIVDPIDGSLNAKRDACHYALSLAVADGETMADVTFGFVHDFGSGEQRTRAGLLELVGVEAADPRWLAGSAARLAQCAHRVRALGTIAATLCQVAAARYDGMVTLRPCRGVDAAAGQLIVREAGGLVAFCECDLPLGAPLDAAQGSHLVAARTPRALEQLRAVVLG